MVVASDLHSDEGDGSLPVSPLCVLWTVLLVASGWPATLYAQGADEEDTGDYVEPNERQTELNNDAVRAIVKEDFPAAVSLLEESLAVGELNVTHLNLGRAYQQIGNCSEARHHLKASKTAPTVKEPPPDVVERKAEQYLDKLSESCPERKSFESASATKQEETQSERPAKKGQTRAETDAKEEPEKKERERDPPPKEETETKERKPARPKKKTSGSPPTDEKETKRETSTGKDDEKTPASTSIDTGPPSPPDEKGAESTEGSVPAGAILLGLGGVTGGTSLGFHLRAESQRSKVRNAEKNDAGVITSVTRAESLKIRRSANLLDTLSIISAGVTAAAVGFGTYLLLTDRPSQSDAEVALGVVTSGSGAALQLQANF